jgi:hypothetical protein
MAETVTERGHSRNENGRPWCMGLFSGKYRLPRWFVDGTLILVSQSSRDRCHPDQLTAVVRHRVGGGIRGGGLVWRG